MCQGQGMEATDQPERAEGDDEGTDKTIAGSMNRFPSRSVNQFR